MTDCNCTRPVLPGSGHGYNQSTKINNRFGSGYGQQRRKTGTGPDLQALGERLLRSSFWKMKSSIWSRKSSARPALQSRNVKVTLLINLRIIWCIDDHRVWTLRININARRSVIFWAWNNRVTKSSHCCFLWRLDRTVRTIFRSYGLSQKSVHVYDVANTAVPSPLTTEYFLTELAWLGQLRYHPELQHHCWSHG